ncbi:DUF3800 domain-containing protein [Sphingomonas sp. ASV193]|uniref:DUF3800 domain-containing protein n=1 Tax=Sphingomonas sp. ASV193 TaxID=3144405 RepID=UPI0032E8CA02
MYLCFIDESGSPPKPTQIERRPPYFVIAGVIIHEAQWHGISEELNALKNRPEFRVRGEIKWRYFGPQNTDHCNSVAHLDQAARDAFRAAFYAIITKRKAVKIIACVASVAAAYEQPYVRTQEDLYQMTYKPVSERFQYFLQDMERTVGSSQLGIMIADHRGKSQDEGLRHRHHRFVEGDAPVFSTYKNYIETIFLTPSHNSVGIQLADMVAGAIGRKFNSDERQFYDAIEPAFRRNGTRIDGYGLVKFPTKGWR